MIGALFGVVVLAWVLIYSDHTTAPRVEAWLAITAASAVWQLLLCLGFWRARPADARWRFWAGAFCAAGFVEGCRWGLGEIWLATPGSIDQQLWVLLVATSAAASAVSSLGSFTPAFYALLLPATVPFAIWSVSRGDPLHWAMAVLDMVFATAVALLGRVQSASLTRALELRFENLDLADDLKFQKERAESANAAKTSFLAAASHDLRQPLHALGMFVAALERQPMGPGARGLTGQIDESLDAMNGLLDALLDVSQLDAGVVHPRPSVFPIQPLLERICRDYAPELNRKGVGLGLHPCSLSVRTDPAMLEQILRNLLSNAVRYTDRGRVVVGCRRGPRLTVGVWDTGPGIAPDHQARIFEEFYQIGNLERDRDRGLGLGLAITRRVAALIDCPVTLRSTPGRGSAFMIQAPLAAAEPVIEAPAAEPMPATGVGLIAVVDDEAAVREGMRSLLRAWGYDVVVAASGDEIIELLNGRAPRLVICDWRLRGGESAMTVIARVRAACRTTIPALLITGDTAPERLREAHDTGLVLLHKPVPGGRLRAAIGNLINERGPPAS
ncbi:MAG TPA: hybrid sensor histidine kinase/response regulator [Caulobacteraceae bacterium]